MSTVDPLVLTIEARAELERRLRAQTTAHRDRQRAQVVLLAADGVPGKQIAAMVGLSQQSVCKWRIQFCDRGLDGLDDAPRSGRPLVYGPTDRLVLMAKVTGSIPGLIRSGHIPSWRPRWRRLRSDLGVADRTDPGC